MWHTRSHSAAQISVQVWGSLTFFPVVGVTEEDAREGKTARWSIIVADKGCSLKEKYQHWYIKITDNTKYFIKQLQAKSNS